MLALLRRIVVLLGVASWGLVCTGDCAAQTHDELAWSPHRSSAGPPRVSLAPGEWLLDVNRNPSPGDPDYVLRDASGVVVRYVEPTRAVDLRGAVGRAVRIKHDTGQTLLATQLDLGLGEVAQPAPRAFRPNPGTTNSIRPVQHLSDDPTTPIVLEELPIGNPSPAPVGNPVLLHPPMVSDSPLPAAPGHVCGSACGPECGDACLPYGYSSNPGYVAPDLWQLFDSGYWSSRGESMWTHAAPPRNPWGIELGGWTQLGYHTKQTPLSLAKGDLGAFNDAPSGLRWQQQWFWIGREADGRSGPDWGFRFDVMYGTDAQKTQAFGNQSATTPGFGRWDASFDHGYYGWAMPQMYGEVAEGDWSVIFGHFFTPVGYEVVTAPDNFFYSHSLTMYNSEPFTHTGTLATYQPYAHPSGLEVYLGYTLGWDTGFDQAFGGSNFIGGWSVRPLQSVTFAYLATIGNLGTRSGGGSGYTHSIVADVAVTPRLTYVLQSDYVDYNDKTGTGQFDDQVSVNNYLLYAMSRCWGAGARVEWWRTDGDSYYEMTYGLNWRPHPSVVVRPEVRYDWSPGGPLAPNRTTLGIDAILVY